MTRSSGLRYTPELTPAHDVLVRRSAIATAIQGDSDQGRNPPQPRRLRAMNAIAKPTRHHAPRSTDEPLESPNAVDASVPRMTSPIAWIGRTAWIAPSQSGSLSEPLLLDHPWA